MPQGGAARKKRKNKKQKTKGERVPNRESPTATPGEEAGSIMGDEIGVAPSTAGGGAAARDTVKSAPVTTIPLDTPPFPVEDRDGEVEDDKSSTPHDQDVHFKVDDYVLCRVAPTRDDVCVCVCVCAHVCVCVCVCDV
jgi:hypothetical protein